MVSRRYEQLALARALRDEGKPWHEVAALLRREYGMNARLAMRLAHGWGQADAAEAWNRRWPDEPKTFKNFSYWENWPGDTGYMPSLATLDRLAQLYECGVADLLTGWGEYRALDQHNESEPAAADHSETLAWKVSNLELPELTRAIAQWAGTADSNDQRSLLLKLSMAAAIAASVDAKSQASRTGVAPLARLDDLTGTWLSRYSYQSAGRDSELEDSHCVELHVQDGRLIGRSLSHDSASRLELELSVNGTVATGTWTERTAPTGYYRAATYHGILQLVVDPTGRSMNGQWLGVGKRFTVNSGAWSLTWQAPSRKSGSAEPLPDR
jgi:hypothetical protein